METLATMVKGLFPWVPEEWVEGALAVYSVSEAFYILLCGIVVYGLFFGLGFGLSYVFAFNNCQKTDSEKSAKYAAAWAIYPAIAFYAVRIFEMFRSTFDDVFMVPWISIGYVVALAALAYIFQLSSDSIQNICVASLDEAQEFRDRLAAQQAAKDAAAKVRAAEESNPASVPVAVV